MCTTPSRLGIIDLCKPNIVRLICTYIVLYTRVVDVSDTDGFELTATDIQLAHPIEPGSIIAIKRPIKVSRSNNTSDSFVLFIGSFWADADRVSPVNTRCEKITVFFVITNGEVSPDDYYSYRYHSYS